MSGDILHDLSRSFIFKTPPNADFVYSEENFLNPRFSYLPHAVAGIGDAGLPKTARPVGIADPGYNRVL
jgi:hypothetical protein